MQITNKLTKRCNRDHEERIYKENTFLKIKNQATQNLTLKIVSKPEIKLRSEQIRTIALQFLK